jgi:hypothetical protein
MNNYESPIYKTPILLKGYHPDHNPSKDYKLGKSPISTSTGFTKPDYKTPTADACQNWIASGGWVGHLVPEGMHILDVEDSIKIKLFRDLCRWKGITPPINVTNNGLQFIFSTNGGATLPGADGRITRMGFPVTDRSAGKNYVILPPVNGRTFEHEDQLNNPPVIPDELLPAQNTTPDTRNALAWALGDAHRKGLLAGYEDLDGGFMALLISCKTPEAQVLAAYQLAFLNDYDERRTLEMYQRTKERAATEKPLNGIGSLVQSLKDKGLESIVATITKFERLSGKTTQSPKEDEKKKRESKTDKLIDMALAEFEFFHDKDLKAYATIQREKHPETYPLRSKGFRTCLAGQYWKQFGEGIGGQVIQDALGTLEGNAIHGGPCYPVHVRLAERNDNIYLDLGNERFEVVEITPDGWTVLGNQNVVKFRRPSGMTALPYPKEGGKFETLKKYVNLANSDDWPILVGYILMCLNPWGPYPILSFTGEQGSAKSTGQNVIKAITDPSSAPLRSLPKETRDLAISSMNSFVLAYDNLSDIPGCMSDALCRQATGSGYATRTLYTDDEETIIDTKRPIMLNGIDNVIRRHDLADRSIIINLAVISDEKRIAEADFWSEFDDDAPEILGAILDAVACSLRNFKNIKLPLVPRMADFTIWVTAAEPALGWTDGTFLKAYSNNRREVVSMTLDADLVGTATKNFMEKRAFELWEGTASELLDVLDQHADERTKKGRGWPHSPSGLSGKLKRSATALRAERIEVTIGQDRQNKKRFIRLEQVGEKIVPIVSNIRKDTQHDDNTSNSTETMFKEKIVSGSSPEVKDRPQYQVGDDVISDKDDPVKKIVPDINTKDIVKINCYKHKNDGDDKDDQIPLPELIFER